MAIDAFSRFDVYVYVVITSLIIEENLTFKDVVNPSYETGFK